MAKQSEIRIHIYDNITNDPTNFCFFEWQLFPIVYVTMQDATGIQTHSNKHKPLNKQLVQKKISLQNRKLILSPHTHIYSPGYALITVHTVKHIQRCIQNTHNAIAQIN